MKLFPLLGGNPILEGDKGERSPFPYKRGSPLLVEGKTMGLPHKK